MGPDWSVWAAHVVPGQTATTPSGSTNRRQCVVVRLSIGYMMRTTGTRLELKTPRVLVVSVPIDARSSPDENGTQVSVSAVLSLVYSFWLPASCHAIY